MRILLSAILGFGIFLSACSFGSGESSAVTNIGSVSRRDIPASLRASCPALTSARQSASEGNVASSQTESVSYSIYDSTGAFVVLKSFTLTGSSSSVGSVPNLAWDFKDAQGNTVPTGHYFVFAEVRDSSGTLVGSKDICMGVVR
jgi:hypothetical protein